MRARFGGRRRRRVTADSKPAIDASRWLEKIIGDDRLGIASLERFEVPGVPDFFALTGRGASAQGEPLIVGFSPTAGGDALLGALVAAAAEPDFTGRVLALAPHWSVACRRRLSVLSHASLSLEAKEAAWLGPDGGLVQPEAPERAAWLPAGLVGASLESEASRQIFARALAALEGLAAKHGGGVSAYGGRVELILMARRVASLHVDGDAVVLETLIPRRSGETLKGDSFADEFDRLEGNLRKHLGDRKVRDGEDGMRVRVLPLLSDSLGLRDVIAWPVGGVDRSVIDLVGVDADGCPVIGATRASLDLSELAGFLDAALGIRGALDAMLGSARGRVSDESPLLVLGAQEVGEGVASVLASLAPRHQLFEIRSRRGRGYELSALAEGEAWTPQREGRAVERPKADDTPASGSGRESDSERDRESNREADSETAGGRGRRRRRGGRGRRGTGSEAREEQRESRPAGDEEGRNRGSEAAPAPFDEVSLFDLEDDTRGERSSERRRGGRSRRRRRGSSADDSQAGEEAERAGVGRPGSDGGTRNVAGSPDSEETARSGDTEPGDSSVDADADMEELLAPLPDGVVESEAAPEPAYDDGEGSDEPEAPGAPAEIRQTDVRPAAVPEEPKPRRRVAIVAHADPDSLLAAVLLARDIRLIVGIWVYPQAELMTFFRSVVTDLKEETPIFVVGFTPSPAREVLQAVSLCSDRLTWLDHHAWPPEDLEAVTQAIGAENVHVSPGTGSCLPAVLAGATRRSRFSDKLVDLATGRFTPHDYQRWGRLWWSRLGEIAERSGDRLSDLDPLLVGRPSDLAREAERVGVPEAPQEISYVATRDFRLVHFAGYVLVVLEVEDGLNPHLAARIARERYSAPLSLTNQHGSDVFVLASDEPAGRRSLDVARVVGLLADKLEWVEALAENDHLARFQIKGLQESPERLEEVIGMVAMARSALER